MTADEKLFLEENVELPPGLFNKRSMGSITIPPQLNSAKEWVLSKRESLRPYKPLPISKKTHALELAEGK